MATVGRGNARARFTAKYPGAVYNPYGLAQLPEADVRIEYTRMRNAAVKRINRIKSDPRWGKNPRVPETPKLAELRTPAQVRLALADLHKWMGRRTSSVSGLNNALRRSVKTLRERYGIEVTMDNVDVFGEFMEWARVQSLGRLYDSERIAELMDEGEDLDSLKDKFNKYLKESEQEGLLMMRDGSKTSSQKFGKKSSKKGGKKRVKKVAIRL